MEMDGKCIRWRKPSELPMDKNMSKKVLLLVKGKLSGNDSLHVVTIRKARKTTHFSRGMNC